MLDRIKFSELMMGLGEMYGQQITEFMTEMYYNTLMGYEYEELEQAVNRVVRIHKYHTLPKPAEIIECLEGSQDDKSLVAWLDVKKAIEKGGYYASIQFADPIIPQCINDLGGWMEFCSLPAEEEPFIQKRFMDLYRVYLKRGGVRSNQKLIGFHENHNKALGEKNREPLVIGERKQKQIGKI
jgi:hypothetical protein